VADGDRVAARFDHISCLRTPSLMPPTLTSVAISFVVLLIVFRLIELLRSADRRLPVMRRGFWADMVYWAFTPLVTRLVTRASTIAVVVPIALLIYGRLDRDLILNGFGPLAQLPLAIQAAIILLVSDFCSYWGHRAFHKGRLWRFHAVHHSSTDLDWLSSVRLHPANDVIMRALGTAPVLAIGVKPTAVAALLPVITLMAIVVHANVDWDWGALRAVIASPRFHRWHHTNETEARDKNFAGMFPIWDILFGTYYMPRGKLPSRFGTDTPVPEGLIAQLAFPFRRSPAAAPLAPTTIGSSSPNS
jgi:sterol desaturase/sphingolipid hydroxylase (fatty acid hydroxylase superfamily)